LFRFVVHSDCVFAPAPLAMTESWVRAGDEFAILRRFAFFVSEFSVFGVIRAPDVNDDVAAHDIICFVLNHIRLVDHVVQHTASRILNG